MRGSIFVQSCTCSVYQIHSPTLWQERRVLSSPFLINPAKSCPRFPPSFLLRYGPLLAAFLYPRSVTSWSLAQYLPAQSAKSPTIVDHDVKHYSSHTTLNDHMINMSCDPTWGHFWILTYGWRKSRSKSVTTWQHSHIHIRKMDSFLLECWGYTSIAHPFIY